MKNPMKTAPANDREISGRKKEEANIRRMATVVRDSNDAITIQDFKGRITAWNRGAELMYGYSEEEALQKNIWLLTPPDRAEEQKDFTRRLIAGEKITSLETQRVTKDGRILDIWMTVTKLVDDSGKPVGIASTERDITERNKNEEALRESEERYHRITEELSDYFYTVQIRNGLAVKTIHSPTCKVVTGYVAEEFAANPYLWFNMIPKQEHGRILEHTRNILAGKKMPAIEHHIVRKDGIILWVCDTPILKFDAEGVLISYDGVINDITKSKKAEEERLLLEEQLLQGRKMEAIGQLAGGVAHDFNNLLLGIVGNCELIKRECGDKSIQAYAQHVIDIALKGGTLTQQLLSFARKRQYIISLSDVREAITNIVSILKHSIDKRIAIVVKTCAEPLWVKTETAQLENAILNLCINARDAMPQGGQLVLTAGGVRLSEADCSQLTFKCPPGDYAEITVRDTGIGMDKETQSHIFEPFFTTKEVGKGTGLGLPSVFGFTKQMNGHVHVYSEKGHGSIFKIRLPLSQEKKTDFKEEESVLVKGHGHILLVEDEPGIRTLITNFLTSLEYSVTCCADGEEGVRYFKENSEKVDLVILDLIMPKLGGYDCFMELRNIAPSIPVIISSGFGINTEVQKMLDSGAKGFIQKPYEFMQLSKLIAEVIRIK